MKKKKYFLLHWSFLIIKVNNFLSMYLSIYGFTAQNYQQTDNDNPSFKSFASNWRDSSMIQTDIKKSSQIICRKNLHKSGLECVIIYRPKMFWLLSNYYKVQHLIYLWNLSYHSSVRFIVCYNKVVYNIWKIAEIHEKIRINLK